MKRINCFVERYCLPMQGQEKGTRKYVETNSTCFKFNFAREDVFRIVACAVREKCTLLNNHQAEIQKDELKNAALAWRTLP